MALVTGPGVVKPFWEIPRPCKASSKTFIPRVIGSTNPIWLDADGTGRFQSAHEHVTGLLAKLGREPLKL